MPYSGPISLRITLQVLPAGVSFLQIFVRRPLVFYNDPELYIRVCGALGRAGQGGCTRPAIEVRTSKAVPSQQSGAGRGRKNVGRGVRASMRANTFHMNASDQNAAPETKLQ